MNVDGNERSEEIKMNDLRTAQINEIVDATVWGTLTLASWSLNWHRTDGLGHVWELISTSQDEARKFYAEIKDDEITGVTGEPISYLRWCAAEALVDGGWDLRAINHRKS
jgi:hypothetical protein